MKESNNQGFLRPNDLLAIIVIAIGSLGFILWGIGLSSAGNSALRWLGTVIVGIIGLLIVFLGRWLK